MKSSSIGKNRAERKHKSQKALNAFVHLKYDQNRTVEYKNVLPVLRISMGKIERARFNEERLKTVLTGQEGLQLKKTISAWQTRHDNPNTMVN
jgi:hypothetical protein